MRSNKIPKAKMSRPRRTAGFRRRNLPLNILLAVLAEPWVDCLNESIQIDPCSRRTDGVPCLHVPACNNSSVTIAPFFNDRGKKAGCQQTMDDLCNSRQRNGACMRWIASEFGEAALPLVAKRSHGCANCSGANSTLDWRCWANHSSNANAYCGKDQPSPSKELQAAHAACPAALAEQQTHVQLCHSTSGLWVRMNATDADIFSNAEPCNDETIALGDVLEMFVSAVPSPLDNPSWYLELDTGSSGVLWGALTYNAQNSSRNSKVIQGGNYSSTTCSRYVDQHPHVCNAAGCSQDRLSACQFDCSGKARFPDGTTARVTQGSGWWANTLFVPWSLVPGTELGPPQLLRFNVYRYDYPTRLPNGSWDRRREELSAWSPSGYGNFHLPRFFGVGVLV